MHKYTIGITKNKPKEQTRIPSGLYKSYTVLEARVESRSANHRPSRLGHVGAHDGL